MEKIKKKILYKLITLAIAMIVIAIAAFFVSKDENKENTPIISTDNTTIQKTEISKESDLNKLNINLISNYTQNYKNVNVSGNNLIDGSYANRTIWVFTLTGVSDLNTYFKDVTLYVKDKEININRQAFQYNKDEVLVVITCDNLIEDEPTFLFTVLDPETGDSSNISKEYSNEDIIIEENAYVGDIVKITNDGFWYRTENGETENRISKNGDNGPYFEYVRTLTFFSFGNDNVVNKDDFKFISDLQYEYDLDISISEIENNQPIEYKLENSTGLKKVTLTFKIYAQTITDKINEDIINSIDFSYLKYNNQKIYITEGIISSEHFDS